MPRAITVIRHDTPWWVRLPSGLIELVRYRDLLWFMTMNRLRVRYQQTWLGWAWAVVQPLAFMAIYTLAGSAIGGRQSSDIAYPLFVLASLPPWTFCATSLVTATSGMLGSSSLMAKVYFPREIIPLSYVLAALADLVIATALAMAALILAGHGLPATALLVVPICAALALFIAALALLLSVAQVWLRDIAVALPVLIQVLVFTTPVLYPLAAVPAWLRPYYELNPLAVLVEAFRGALLGSVGISAGQFAYAGVFGAVALVVAFAVFKAAEPWIVDEI